MEREQGGAAARPPRRSNAARLFGYDMFISFALGPLPRGTQSYASDLARRLRERDFTVFFSEDEAPPGEPLTPTLRAALHRARVLVVVANRGTLAEPRWVRSEVEEFRARHPGRPVIPISVGGALQDPALAGPTQAWLGHEDKIWLDEAEQAVAEGIAGEALVQRLALAPGRARANVRWRWVVRGVIASLLALTAAAIAAAVFALRQRDEAVRQNVIAQAGRLAAQADLLRERGGPADASVMLAAEGLRQLAAIGERSLEVDRSLRGALALLPRFQEEVDSHHKVRLAPSGQHLIIENVADQISVRQLPGGELASCRWEDIAAPGDPARVRLVTAASSNGDWCVVREFDQGGHHASLQIWSARPLRQVASFPVASKAGHVYPAISDDGALLAATDHAQTGRPAEGTMYLWSRSTQAELLRLEGEEFLAFSPDSRHFATTSGLWRRADKDTARPTRVIPWASAPYYLVFSRDSAQVATRESHDGAVNIWDVNGARLLRTASAPKGELLAMDNGGRLLMVGGHQDAVLWDSLDEAARGRVPFELKAAAFASANPTLLAQETDRYGLTRLRVLSLPAWGAALAGTEVGAAEQVLWLGLRGEVVDLLTATDSARRLETWDFRQGTRTTAATLPATGPWAVSAEGRHLAVATEGKVLVVPIGAQGPPREIVLEAPADFVALDSDGAHLAATTAGRIEVRRLSDGQRWASPPLAGPAHALMVSRDGNFALAVVASGEASRSGPAYTLVRWRLADPADPAASVTIDLGRHLHPPPILCAVSADGLGLWVGGARQEIAPGMKMPPGLDIENAECAPAASPSLRLATQDSRVVVSATSGLLLAQLDHGARIVASADGRRVATVTEGRGVQVFTLDPAELIAEACARGPRPLSDEEWRQYLGTSPPLGTDACGRPRPGDKAP